MIAAEIATSTMSNMVLHSCFYCPTNIKYIFYTAKRLKINIK
jgi:hypothetical protein